MDRGEVKLNATRYVVRRLVLALVVLVGISIITFIIVRILPSNPAAIYLGFRAQPEQIEKLTIEMGLDKSLYYQYGIYVKNLAMGDWGNSLRTHRPVLNDIKEFFPKSLELLILAISLSALVGIPLGVMSARFKGKVFDHFTRVVSIFGVSVPSFWIALVLQYIFFTKLGLLPINGQMSVEIAMNNPVSRITGLTLVDALMSGNWIAFWNMIPHYILPVVTLALYPLGLITRMTRSNVAELLDSDFIRLAQANGIAERKILFQYLLKNAMGPILTVLGLMFSYSVMGSFFVELIYNWPGVGSYAVRSILSMDYPAIMGVTLLVAFVYLLMNLLTDLIHSWMDPRIRLGEE